MFVLALGALTFVGYLIARYVFLANTAASILFFATLGAAAQLAYETLAAAAASVRKRLGFAGAALFWLIAIAGIAAGARAFIVESTRTIAPMQAALAAIAVEEWDLALEHLDAANRAQPADPATLRLAGLVGAVSGGRDVLAVAWLRAYLAAAPGAADTAQVSKTITDLERRARADVERLVAEAIRIAESLDEDEASLRDEAYLDLVRAQSARGRAAEARKARDAIRDADLRLVADSHLSPRPKPGATPAVSPNAAGAWLGLVADDLAPLPWLAGFGARLRAVDTGSRGARMRALAQAAAEMSEGLAAIARLEAQP